VADVSTALNLVKQGKARILIRFGNIVKDFHVHVIYATNKLIASKPDAIAGFLKGWFEAIAFMRSNKAATVAIGVKVLHKDVDIMSETYDEVMPMFSTDGRFNQKALDTLARSWVDLKILPKAPDLKLLYTEAFLPSAQ
jgi:ABC-type nitrate/sulfonate/bicarbonate transport system substrate-binding protein